jgi:hypothetical protein
MNKTKFWRKQKKIKYDTQKTEHELARKKKRKFLHKLNKR